MKWLAVVMISGGFAGAPFCQGSAENCSQVAVQSRVEAGRGELTLADLLGRDSCAQLREAAARVSLGRAPRAGSVRALDGREIRRRLEELAGAGLNRETKMGMQIPEHIVVRRAGATKSCRDIARFVASASPAQKEQEELNCAAARDIVDDAALVLTKSSWNAALRRWEFALRCARAEDCVPFLVWAREENKSPAYASAARSKSILRSGKDYAANGSGGGDERLVKPGQTATLTWEQAGLRIVLPVTCLDAGGLGQFVRVRFKNAARILRAEVMGKAMLRASL